MGENLLEKNRMVKKIIKNKKSVVSIVIVNYNGKDLIKLILDSVKEINSNHYYEVFVVDNNSTDNSQEYIKKKYPKVKLIQNKKNLGYSGINSALKYCKGEYILFLNNDMKIDKTCISKLIETIKSDKNVAMAAPKLINFYNKTLKSGGTWVSRSFYNGHIKGNGNKMTKEIPYLGVGLIKKDYVDTFGYLFDPDYFIYAEDLDLGLRIRLIRKKIIFNPDAIIYHMHAVTTKKSKRYKMTFLLERNLLMTFFKILSTKNILLLFPYVFGMRALAITKDLLTFNISNFIARLRAIIWIFFNFGLIMKKRKHLQKIRKADDNYVLKIFTEKYLFKKKFLI